MSALIECVPNFSAGRDLDVVRQITARIESVEGATLLHVDPGKATNRTVVTFAGEPEPVVEAAFRAIAAAAELIDMRQHSGAHPRMGATDVCPLVPISGIAPENSLAPIFKALPTLVLHGIADTENPIAADRRFVTEVERIGGKQILFREYEGLEHQLPAEIFPGYWWRDWLFEQSRR